MGEYTKTSGIGAATVTVTELCCDCFCPEIPDPCDIGGIDYAGGICTTTAAPTTTTAAPTTTTAAPTTTTAAPTTTTAAPTTTTAAPTTTTQGPCEDGFTCSRCSCEIPYAVKSTAGSAIPNQTFILEIDGSRNTTTNCRYNPCGTASSGYYLERTSADVTGWRLSYTFAGGTAVFQKGVFQGYPTNSGTRRNLY